MRFESGFYIGAHVGGLSMLCHKCAIHICERLKTPGNKIPNFHEAQIILYQVSQKQLIVLIHDKLQISLSYTNFITFLNKVYT